MMELLDLPDDVLLMVLRYLNPSARELLRLRGLCRRVRDLAVHPWLWRTRRVSDIDRELCRAVMRLVPSVGELQIYDESLSALAAKTNCAARFLDLHLPVHTFAVVLRRQAALGRLRKLAVSLGNNSTGEKLGTVVDAMEASGVEELVVHDCYEVVPPPLPDRPIRPTLKKLVYFSYCRSHARLEYLLRTHSATLEAVLLCNLDFLPSGLAARLAALPNLRHLECPVLEDMRPLLECRKLAKLALKVSFRWYRASRVLNVDREYQVHLESAADFLRGAEQLEELTLFCSDVSGCAKMLRLTKRLGIQALSLSLSGPGTLDLESMAASLPSLLWLRALDLHTAPNKSGTADYTPLLSAISPRSAPRLRELRLEQPRGCLHAWLHRGGLQLLTSNPGLHLRMRAGLYRCKSNKYRNACQDSRCFFCDLTCHRVLVAGVECDLGLFLHPEDQTGSCGVQHVDSSLWVMA